MGLHWVEGTGGGRGGLAFRCFICEGGDAALDSFEGFVAAFYVLFVVVPFGGFGVEARGVCVLC